MGTCSETICKHRIFFPSIQHLAWLHQGRPQGTQKCGKIAIFGLTHWLKHRITRKLLKIDRYMLRGVIGVARNYVWGGPWPSPPLPSPFSYRRPHFCFPWRRPFDYHAICSMDEKTIQCLPNLAAYLSIFNSFRVIRCLSQCVSPKIAIFTTFLFPLGTPLGQSR